MQKGKFTYKNAGVFKDKHLAKIGFEIARQTKTEFVYEVAPGILSINDEAVHKIYKNPVYKHESDGIGSKEQILAKKGADFTSGYDLVIANTNDLIRWGAWPLAIELIVEFTNIKDSQFNDLMQGAVKACSETGCAITGGETAQRPNFLSKNRYHLSATAIGVCEANKFISGEKSQIGNLVLGLPSIGLHTNGYSLVLDILKSSILDYSKKKWNSKIDSSRNSLLAPLTVPHKNYYQTVTDLIDENVEIHRIVHITGGGLENRLNERLPKDLTVKYDKRSHPIPSVFSHLQKLGNLSDDVMYSTFNMGIGMTLDLPEKEVVRTQKLLSDIGEESYVIGKIVSNTQP